uniref:Putative secreted protein n=1 Tax=Rhipicephalus microplus TaxID=6941 RepID=A0A6M2DES3_RHIMP
MFCFFFFFFCVRSLLFDGSTQGLELNSGCFGSSLQHPHGLRLSPCEHYEEYRHFPGSPPTKVSLLTM